MKNHYLNLRNRTVLIFLSAVLFFVFEAKAQSFQIVWGMNRTLAGVSSTANFTPHNAELFGAHPHSLPAVLYYAIGSGDYAYGTTYWLASTAGKYLEFSFSANTYEYDLTSVSFRVRRSPDGPKDVALRSSLDGFATDIATKRLTTDGLFYNVTIPLGLANLSSGLTFRIYGYNAGTYLGVIYFDQIVINGKVTNYVLPVDLTYFTANPEGKVVNLAWETSWERNSKEFLVERSTDLVEFKSIGKVEAGGDATGRLQYIFIDESPLTGVSYYRLKMVDNDENYNYSGNRDVVIKLNSNEMIVSPNPASASQIRIIKGNIDPSALVLTNSAGRNIEFDFVDFKDSYINIYPDQPLPSGLYILSILQNGRKLQAKVLVP